MSPVQSVTHVPVHSLSRLPSLDSLDRREPRRRAVLAESRLNPIRLIATTFHPYAWAEHRSQLVLAAAVWAISRPASLKHNAYTVPPQLHQDRCRKLS